MSIEQKIKPFMICYHEASTSFILGAGEYRQEIFVEREGEGFVGSGYDWASLACVFLDEKMPALKSEIKFDPEADMFCVYSDNRRALEDFALAFHAMCEDTAQMRDFFSRAELD